MENKRITVDVSWISIFKVLAVVFGVFMIYYLFDIFLLLFFVIILSSALSPLVDKIKVRFHIPRIMAILLIYLILLFVVGFVAYTIIPLAITQFSNFNQNLPAYAQKITAVFSSFSEAPLSSTNPIQGASSSLGNVAGTLVKSASSFFGGLATIFYILVLTLFLLLEEDGIRKFFVSLLPITQKSYILEITKKLSDKMGSWLLGQVTLMLIIGAFTTLGLWAIGIPYALTLGIIAGLLEVVPTIGPMLAAIPAVLIAYMDTPWKAVFVLIFAVIIQQLENQLIVPKVMNKAVGVSPFIILVALLIGGKLGGTLGVLIAIPSVAALSVLSKEWPNIRKRL